MTTKKRTPEQNTRRALNAKRLRRLRRLRDVIIPAIDTAHLDFGTWKCGTLMCIGGFACADKTFNRQGLHLEDRHEWPVYNGQPAYNALNTFFMLGYNEACQLFGIQCEETLAQELQKRIGYLTELITKYGGKS